MSLKELFLFRLPQQFQLHFLGKFHQFKQFNGSKIQVNKKFLSNSYSFADSLSILTQQHDLKFSFFDCELDLSTSINWLKDYKNNKQSEKKYYSNIDRQNFNRIGDIKYVFEPSRFYFLPFLALKAIVNQDEYLQLIEKIIKDWQQQNPYLQTVHWTSGIEVGIRSVNLVYTHMVLNSCGILTKFLDQSIKKLIQYNYHYLGRHLSLYSSANNHLVAELTGLVVISSYFDNKTFRKERILWSEKLFNEIKRQVNNDGVNMELCTHYHAEGTDHFFNALLFIKKSGQIIPKTIENRFLKMFDFLDHVEFKGIKTVFGDNDEGALINPFFNKDFSIYQSLLQSAEFYYKMPFFSKLEAKPDLRNYLIFGDSILQNSPAKSDQVHKDTVFRTSGYAFFYDHDKSVKVSFDFGNIGDNISAAHGHSDIFHFNFDINGEPILMDSGTYQYHKRYEKWRTYFRGISSHNTISINHKDQALQATRMSWLQRPITKLVDFEISKKVCTIKAETNAYEKENIKHKRQLTLNKKEKLLCIMDDLTTIKKDSHPFTISFYLNFGDNVELNHENEKLLVSTKYDKITIENAIFSNGQIIKANQNGVLGWRSKAYNEKYPGQLFVVEYEFAQDQTLTTYIHY